jgi:hypothetical protein
MRGEVVRVSVYAVQDPNIIPNPNEAPGDFVVRILDTRGVQVVERKAQLAGGVVGSADIPMDNPSLFPADAFRRRTLRVEVLAFNPQPDPSAVYFATLEVFEGRSGQTRLFVGDPGQGQVPNPER